MAKQTIPVVKVKFIDRFTDPQNPRTMYRPGIKTQAVINSDKLIENIMNHSGQKRAQVLAVMAALPDAVKDYATAGHAVQIDGLVTIKPLIHVRAVSTPEECTADTIKSVTIRAYPIGETAAMVKKWGFKMTDLTINGNASDENGGVDEPNNPGGENNNSTNIAPSAGVTIKWRDHSNTLVKEITVEIDSELTEADIPQAQEGYHWNFTLADLNLAIGMKQPGDTVTVREQAD